MGCDIHIHVEYKVLVKGRKKWQCGDYFMLNPYYGTNEYEKEKYSVVDFCGDRNYLLFSVLADVRNYADNAYISEPRGLPADISKEVKAIAEDWGEDGHSHSYLTLQELLDFQKTIPPLRHKGMISPEAQKALDEKGITPDMYCQGINAKGWEWREWTEENTVLLSLIEALKQRADELCLIHHFYWDKDFEHAYKLSENIRIVFWFDN